MKGSVAYRHPTCIHESTSVAALDQGNIVNKLASLVVDDRRRACFVGIGGHVKTVSCQVQQAEAEVRFEDSKSVWSTANVFSALDVTQLTTRGLPDPIQSVVMRHSDPCGDATVAAVDARGRVLIVSGIDASTVHAGEESTVVQETVIDNPCVPCDEGPTALAVGHASGELATCSFFPRTVQVVKDGRSVRTFGTSASPVAIHNISALGNECYGVCQANMMTIYDVRCERFEAASTVVDENLYALAAFGEQVCVVGAERVVIVYDIRKLDTQLGSWRSVTKYDTTYVAMRKGDGGVIVGSSVDSEIAAGVWNKGRKPTASGVEDTIRLRGDSRWVGLDYLRDTNELLGMTARGSLYLLRL